jgi:hypothetical protein
MATGAVLSDEYGRCDHEINCGYFRTPSGDAKTGANGISPSVLPAVINYKQPTTTSVVPIPPEVFAASLRPEHYARNTLAQVLRRHFGVGVANDLLHRFQLGTSAYWPGACVFWLIDEHGRVRGGQVVLYDGSGHTVQKPDRHTRWVHTALSGAYYQSGETLPEWLVAYNANAAKSPCLFGLPQLKTAPIGKPVALVESAKTAMMATAYLPGFVWMATMGLSYLTAKRLEPLRGRDVVLFPDAGAYDLWNEKATELRQLGHVVRVSDALEKRATAAEKAAGLDLADCWLREWPGFPPSWGILR